MRPLLRPLWSYRVDGADSPERKSRWSPASSPSDISGWRGGALYPLAAGSRAARRRRRFIFYLIDGGAGRGV